MPQVVQKLPIILHIFAWQWIFFFSGPYSYWPYLVELFS